jgi:hypothetical protein
MSALATVVAVAVLALPTGAPAHAAAPMAYIYNAPESALDTRYLYHVAVLKAALERTVATHGAYTLTPSVPMSETRQVAEMRALTGLITVVIRGANQDYARVLRPVSIAIDKGILGYRVLLIRRQDQARFAAVRTLDDLKAFSIGQGAGWKDIDILRFNGLRVVTGSSYDGLFEMLTRQRFDAFSRGIEEIGDEYQGRQGTLPDLAIEQSLLLYYPVPRYFWFTQDETGRLLAERVTMGLRMIIADGTLDALFRSHFRAKLESLSLGRRHLIRLANPYLPPGTPQTFDLDTLDLRQ